MRDLQRDERLGEIDAELDRTVQPEPPGWLVAAAGAIGAGSVCGLIYGCIRFAVWLHGGA